MAAHPDALNNFLNFQVDQPDGNLYVEYESTRQFSTYSDIFACAILGESEWILTQSDLRRIACFDIATPATFSRAFFDGYAQYGQACNEYITGDGVINIYDIQILAQLLQRRYPYKDYNMNATTTTSLLAHEWYRSKCDSPETFLEYCDGAPRRHLQTQPVEDLSRMYTLQIRSFTSGSYLDISLLTNISAMELRFSQIEFTSATPIHQSIAPVHPPNNPNVVQIFVSSSGMSSYAIIPQAQTLSALMTSNVPGSIRLTFWVPFWYRNICIRRMSTFAPLDISYKGTYHTWLSDECIVVPDLCQGMPRTPSGECSTILSD